MLKNSSNFFRKRQRKRFKKYRDYSYFKQIIKFKDFLYNWKKHGLPYSLCHSCNPDSVAAYWSFLFAVSKVIELGDTLFIVLRKKPLIFLHYYHHVAVLVYTIHSGEFLLLI